MKKDKFVLCIDCIAKENDYIKREAIIQERKMVL
jgi:hypothetical protein